MKATIQNLGTETPTTVQMHLDPSLVKVQISYPKGYEKKKLFNDGDIVWTSAEGAATYVEKGIGAIVERTAEEMPTGAESPAAPKVAATTAPAEPPAEQEATQTKKQKH